METDTFCIDHDTTGHDSGDYREDFNQAFYYALGLSAAGVRIGTAHFATQYIKWLKSLGRWESVGKFYRNHYRTYLEDNA